MSFEIALVPPSFALPMNARPAGSPTDASGSRIAGDAEAPTRVLISIDDPRVYLAAERTLLAWIRTGVALIGLGFLIAKFGLFLRELALLRRVNLPDPTVMSDQAVLPDGSLLSDWIGAAVVILGALLALLAGFDHMRMLRRLGTNDLIGAGRRYLSGSVTILVGITGILLAAYLLLL